MNRFKKWAAAAAVALTATGVVAVTGGIAHAGTITPLPMQPAITDYQNPSGAGSNSVPYEHQGALIVGGQSQLGSQPVKDASAAGATVLGYLDPMVIQPNSGTWGDMLWQSSVCGAAVPQWGSFNSGTGYQLADFRTVADGGSGVEQAKLHCVLENMVSANPWIAGFFADDLGSKSWYPGINWSTFGSANQQAWYDGAVAMAQTFHNVAVEHGGMLMVNGTWEKGTIASNGGGYPNLAANGVSYASGGYVEHHASSEVAFWTDYASGQWATAAGDPAQGNPIMYVQASDLNTLNTYKNAGVFSFGSYQTDYSQAAPVWGSFHATGLPSGSTSGTQSAPTATTSAATGVTTSAATLNGSVNPNGADASYKFDYGTTTSYGSSTTAGDAGSGTTAVNESAPLTGLSPSTTYHYRVEATNSGGTTLGSDQQFTTSAALVAPVVTTTAATGLTSSGGTVNGTVNPEGQATTYQFEYGTTTGYGSVSPASPGSAGSGTTAVNESSGITGLSASTTYHYRLNATNATGTTHGSDQQFTTTAAGAVVAFDAAAGAKHAGSAALSWTHVVGSGSNRALVVDFTVGDNNDAGCTPVVKDGTTSMSEITAVHDDNQRAGALTVWGLVNPPSGNNTITETVTGCSGTVQEMTGGSESFTGVSQAIPFGAHAVNWGSSATSSVSNTASSSSDLMGEFVANGSQIGAVVSPVIQKFGELQDNNTGAGNTAGGYAPATGSAQSGSWNLTNDWWGAAAVDIQHS